MTSSAKPPGGSSDTLGRLIDTLDLPEFQRELLRNRWLNQLGWMSRQASKARRRYLWLRVPVVLGGVAIPGLVTILLSAASTDVIPWLPNVPIVLVRLATFVVSLGVAMLAALEEVFNYGDRWRHYRRTSELLKTLGWQYLMLTGAFRRYPTHAAAFVPFTERVEGVLNEDVEGYLDEVASERGDRQRTDIIG